MIPPCRLATLSLLLSLSTAAPAVAADPPARLTVNAAAPGQPVSPLLYGVFFEEINHAGDGGLYAELVRNRSFEDRENAPESWSPVTTGGAEGSIALDIAQPLNAKTPHALRIDITRAATGGGVGAINEGFWGIAVRDGAGYHYSLWARAGAGYRGPLAIRLEDASGKAIAEGRTSALTDGWRRYEGTITARAGDPAAKLVVRAAAATPGSVWLDVVSLFPKDTFKGRANGLRPDLAQMVADLKPAFVRFPGGCFVEGDKQVNAFRWKESIGDISDRPGHSNLWGYRSSDGLGFHEYLQFCEDIRAEPLFVVNCGMSHAGAVPMSELEPWVQDALDAMDYANAPVSSPWGALRAKHGHPKPFNLRYIEVGNENGGAAYNERYARFYDALKAKHPEVQLVANDWGGMPKSRPIDLLDQHAYNTPDWFASRATLFDGHDRTTHPKVYFGEYAATRGVGLGNLRAAVGEAAFMTGMERNSDLVQMSSYAPLFVHVQDRKWNPDAIAYDAARSYGTPSYYVQQLFARNRPDVTLPCTVEAAPSVSAPVPGGAVGVGTWRTQAEFKEVRVTAADGRVLFSDDFGTAGTAAWKPLRGEWSVANGAYKQASPAEDVRAVAGDRAWPADLTYTLKARKTGGAEGFLVMFRVRGDDDWIWWNIGGWNNTRHALEKTEQGAKGELGNAVDGSIETGRWYDLKVEVRGSRIRCYLDGKLIHDVEDKPAPTFFAAAGREKKSGDLILKVVNYSASAQEADVALQGITGLRSTGTMTVLTSASPTDENTLEAPTKVKPATTSLSGLAPTFRRTFPPYSVTVLRVHPQ